jgi:hypothetical protein
MAAVVSNTSDTTTTADKAAALTFLKINYNWPKSFPPALVAYPKGYRKFREV